jgi:hypothetical protein
LKQTFSDFSVLLAGSLNINIQIFIRPSVLGRGINS